MAAAACLRAPDSPETRKQRIEKIELLLCITAFLLIFLLIVGPMRRRHRNVLLGPISVLLYTLSSSLITYAIALMLYAPFCDQMFPLWAAFLGMVQLGGVDTFSAHSLQENESPLMSFFATFLGRTYLLYLLVALDAIDAKSVIFVTACIVLLVGIKLVERSVSLNSASKSALRRKFRVVADYMSTEFLNSGTDELDPISMRGYRYVVRGEEVRQRSKEVNAPEYRTPLLVAERELITVEEVWDCRGWLLSSSGGDPHGHLKDICLSFSLFKLLILNYTGYSMPREAHQRTWRLIQHGLLSSSGGNGHERVFRVIEQELAFLFGLFYTTYPIILHPVLRATKLLRFVIMPVILGFIATLLFQSYIQVEDPHIVLPKPSQIIVTVLVMLTYVVVEFLQLIFTYTSEWAQVMLLFNYVKRENWHGREYFEKLLKAICGIHFFQWDRKLGQYSLVECFSHRPNKILYNWLTSLFYDQKREGQQEIDPTTLSDQVKQEVIRFLTTNDGERLRNGLSSLRRNGLDRLSWACNLETQAQVIMVWHIATFFCEHEVPFPTQQNENFNTATTLSKYLAYLVAFAPRMLPGHSYVTQHMFDQVVIEARIFFEGCESLEQRIERLKVDGDPMDRTVVGRAIQLGQQLVYQIRDPESNQVGDRGFIWRILAEFWAEMALYVAPSDDVEIHLKHLTLGGEFVTHLWALLHHAGIERAAPPSPSPPPDEDEGVQSAAPTSPPPGEDEGVERAAPPPSEDEEEDSL